MVPLYDGEATGLGEGEQVVEVYRFSGDEYVLIVGTQGDKRSWGRMARVDRRTDAGPDEPAYTYRPICNLVLTVEGHETVVSIDRWGELGTEVSDSVYVFSVSDNNERNKPRKAVIRESAIVDGRRKSEWLVPLELSRRVRGKEATSVLPDLIHALVENFQGDVTQVVDATGPVVTPSGLAYVNGRPGRDKEAASAFNRSGPTAVVAGRLSGEPSHASDVEYLTDLPSWDSVTVAGLDALCRLARSHGDRGVSGVIVGQLISALLAGVPIAGDMTHSRTVIELVGPSMSGKTAFALQGTTSQTRTLYGEIEAPGTAACAAPGESGGTTPRGIYEHHKAYGGCVVLMDDVKKKTWTLQHVMKAHRTILGRVTDACVGGGSMQATATQNGPPSAAKNLNLRCSALVTSEIPTPVPSLLEDSVSNRTVMLWWDIANRCDADTYKELSGEAETLARNDGLRACLQILLEDPAVLSTGWELALSVMVTAGVPPRIAKNYARCLAGLHVLSVAYERCLEHDESAGADFWALLNDVLAGAIGQAQRMVSYGATGGGDELAIANPVEAFREAVRSLFHSQHIYVNFGDGGPGTIPRGPKPGDGDVLPPGVGQEDLGWSWRAIQGDMAEQVGRDLIGRWCQRQSNGRHAFAYRVEMRAQQWASLLDQVAKWCTAKGWRSTPRDELTRLLKEAGVLIHIPKRKGHPIYQLNGAWLTTVATTEVASDDHDDEGV